MIQSALEIQACLIVGQKIGDMPCQFGIAPGGIRNLKQRLRETTEIVYGLRAL